jgi:gliding motility-associated-like protein
MDPYQATYIGRLNLEDCTMEYLIADTSSRVFDDIALCPNNKLYGTGIGVLGDPSTYGIYEIDLINKTFELVINTQAIGASGLVCSCDTVLYWIRTGRLFSYSINSDDLTNHGSIPGGIASIGDSFFFEGNLYTTYSFPTQGILNINIGSPQSSSIVYESLPGHTNGVHLYRPVCEPPLFYIAIPGEYVQIIHTMMPYTYAEAYYCTVPIVGRLSGWAGEPPCITPEPCEIVIDLDGDDSAGLSPVDFSDSVYCRPAAIAIADADAWVDTGLPWDSVRVFVVSPAVGAALFGTPEPGIGFTGTGTSQLTLYNTGGASPADLAEQLTRLYLTPGAAGYNILYTVGVIGYAGQLVSDTAYALLYAGDLPYPAGDDGEVSLCREDITYNFNLLLDPGTVTGGQWSGPGMPADGIAHLSALQPGDYYYIAEDTLCGPDTATWSITLHELPLVNLGADTIVCGGDAVFLEAPAGYAVRWQDGSTDESYEVTATGYYFIEVVSAEGCSAYDTVFIGFLDDIILDTALYLCDGLPAFLLGETYDTPGAYDFFVPGAAGGCDTLWLITVEVVDLADRQIDLQGTLCKQGLVALTAPEWAGASYRWSDGQAQSHITTALPGVFSVTIAYEGSDCSYVFEIAVPACEEPKYYIPNVFSPNGDQVNDIFHVFAPELAEATMSIFDRWGSLLYEGSGAPPVWDGKVKEKDALPGVYVYRLQMRFLNGAEADAVGDVTLVR